MATEVLDDKALRLAIDRARWWALINQPFYGCLAMGLSDVLVDHGATVAGAAIETAATDYRRIYWSRQFLSGLSPEEVNGVLLHEALHCAHLHAWRLPRDADGNAAGDYAINGVLLPLKGVKLPAGGLLPPPEWANLAEEEILARLPERQKGGKNGNGPGADPGGCGGFLPPAQDEPGDGKGDGKGGSPGASKPGKGQGSGDGENGAGAAPGGDGGGSSDDLRDEWKRRLIEAVQAGKASGRGTVPADLLAELERVRHQPIDWRQETADFIKSAATSRADWSRPARRHAWAPVLIPRRRADDLGLVVVVRDTSGSIGAELLAQFSALVSSLLGETRARGLLIDCDATIGAEYELAPGDDCPLQAVGGGGTDFRPPFERASRADADGERVAGLVYLTDGYGPFPDAAPDYPVLWLCTTDVVAPFGRTVRVEGV